MGGQRRRWRRACRARSDLRYNLRISLEDAFAGCKKPSTCPHLSLCMAARERRRRRRRTHNVPDLFRHGQGSCAARVSSPSSAPARPARPGSDHQEPVQTVVARAVSRKTARCLSTSPQVLKQAPASALLAKAKLGCAADQRAISTSFIEVTNTVVRAGRQQLCSVAFLCAWPAAALGRRHRSAHN